MYIHTHTEISLHYFCGNKCISKSNVTLSKNFGEHFQLFEVEMKSLASVHKWFVCT